MVNVTEGDPLATRILILKEFGKVQTQIVKNPELWRKLSFEAHKELCKVLGADFIDYPEFEFWFSRFARGKLYLDYDRSSYPKARSLTDLPVEIFEKVGEYLQLHERMQLRDVCKDIRYQVDNWDLKLDEIYYSNGNDWYLKIRSKLYGACYFAQYVNNILCPRFYRNSNSFLMSVLKLPKLQVEKLKFYEHDEYWKELSEELNKSNLKLHVKKVEFPQNYRSSEIDLHFMIPGVLEEIKLFFENPTQGEISEIIESEQCQAAKIVRIESRMVTSRFPWEALYNCPRFSLYHGKRTAYGLKAKFLKALMKYGKVQECALYAKREIMKYFNEPEAMVPNFTSLRRYPIPETNEYYELEYREKAAHLERKS